MVAVHIRLLIQLGLDNPLETHPTVTTQPPLRYRSETATQAFAASKVEREEALALCNAQPLLSSQTLRDMVEYELRGPHDPELDTKPLDQIMDDVKLHVASECADKMVDHPDTFAEVERQHHASLYQSEIAWDAFNVTCKDRLTASCIKAEVVGAELLRNAREIAKRACSLVLPYEAGSAQQKTCVQTIGNLDPDDSVMLHCALAGKTHSALDASAAGRKLGACFRANVVK